MTLRLGDDRHDAVDDAYVSAMTERVCRTVRDRLGESWSFHHFKHVEGPKYIYCLSRCLRGHWCALRQLSGEICGLRKTTKHKQNIKLNL
jgi:hypothetical protein